LVNWWLCPAREAREEALVALEEWSADPYQRSTRHWRNALRAALYPTITAEDVAALEFAIERKDDRDTADFQQAMDDILESVLHLPVREKKSTVQAKVQRLQEPGEEEIEWTAPIEPQWTRKLLTYYAAAYMDLVIWASLAGHTINVRSLHNNFRKGSDCGDINASITSNEVSVRDFMEKLKDDSILHYLSRLEEDK